MGRSQPGKGDEGGDEKLIRKGDKRRKDVSESGEGAALNDAGRNDEGNIRREDVCTRE